MGWKKTLNLTFSLSGSLDYEPAGSQMNNSKVKSCIIKWQAIK